MQGKVTFITNRTDHNIVSPQIEVISTLEPVISYLNNTARSGLDTENNSLNPFLATHLLLQLGDKNNPFVIDRTSVDNLFLKDYTDKVEFIGTNLQYDESILNWNERHTRPTVSQDSYSITFRKLIDLMVAEQIITRGSGLSNSLESIHLRRLNRQYPSDKSIRDEFIKMNKKSVFSDKHIFYASSDIICLEDIYTEVEKIMNQDGLNRRILDIGFPLVPILTEMCINGTSLDRDKWREILTGNKKKRLELEQAMDAELIRLGYRTKVRKAQELLITDLFGGTSMMSNMNLKNINYSSTQQLFRIFSFFNLPKPQARDKKVGIMKDSTKDEAISQYLISYPDVIIKDFLKTLLEYKSIEKRINSFGQSFLEEIYPDPKNPNGKNNLIRGYYNSFTGKIHTKYKGEFTANGRLSSGSDSKNADGKQKSKKKKSEVFYNSQQLPKENRYRNCFILEKPLVDAGWWRTTLDLAGAELIILGSQSGDKKLLELQAADIHSYLATPSFTNIVKYIVMNMNERRAKDELYELLKVNKVFQTYTVNNEKGDFIRFYTKEEEHQLTLDRVNQAYQDKKFVVNKKLKDLRDPFKNVVYGTAYGAQDARISETLSIPKEYAKIVAGTLRQELPVAFGYLDRVAESAVRNGYIIFNNRTNSRHIFKKVIEARKFGRELNFKEIGEIQRAAMNYSISGTQADMIKESMVNIDKHRLDNGIPFKWIFQVHDELVFDHYGKEYGGVAAKMVEDTCNLYLNGITMRAEYNTIHCWSK